MKGDAVINGVSSISLELILDDGSRAMLVYEDINNPEIQNENNDGVNKTTLTFAPGSYSIVPNAYNPKLGFWKKVCNIIK